MSTQMYAKMLFSNKNIVKFFELSRNAGKRTMKTAHAGEKLSLNVTAAKLPWLPVENFLFDDIKLNELNKIAEKKKHEMHDNPPLNKINTDEQTEMKHLINMPLHSLFHNFFIDQEIDWILRKNRKVRKITDHLQMVCLPDQTKAIAKLQ